VHREAAPALARVRELCVRAGAVPRVRRTSIARPHADASPDADLTVVVGGDGTLREVAGRLVADPAWRGAVLPVPTGTATLFALNAGIRSTEHGLALLEDLLVQSRPGTADAARVLHCDVGWADLERAGGSRSGDLPFLVTAGLGASAATVQATPRWAKDRLGAAGYGIGALGQLGAPQVSLALGCPVDGPEPPLVMEAGPRVASVWAVEFGLIRRIPWGITVFPHGGITTGILAGLAVTFGESGGGLGDGGAQPGWPGGVRLGPDRHPRRTSTAAMRLVRRSGAWGRVFRAGLCGGHAQADALRLWTAEGARVTAARPVAAHLDGEAVGHVLSARLRVSAGALPVIVTAGW
jgi:diacylglycerol kinase family enzyme